MQGKILLAVSGIIAIALAFFFNPLKFPKDEIGKTITKFVPQTKVVTKTVYVNVPGKTIVDTKTIERVRVIRDSYDSTRVAQLLITLDTVTDRHVRINKLIVKKINEISSAAEQLQAEKEALIEDRNIVIDALADATNELWKERADTIIPPKKLKYGIGASYMILGGSKPIYQLTYEKPLTKNISVEIGGLWNGKPGVSGGIKVRF